MRSRTTTRTDHRSPAVHVEPPSTVGAVRRAGRIVGWLALLAGAGVGLWLLGRGPLRGPHLFQPASWLPWTEAHGAVMAAFVALRLLGLVAAGYALAVTALALALRGAGRSTTGRFLVLVALPGMRRFLEGTLGLGLAAAVLAGPVVGPASASPRPVGAAAVTRPVHPDHRVRLSSLPASGPTLRLVPASPGPVLRRLPPGRGHPSAHRGSVEASEPHPSHGGPAAVGRASHPSTHDRASRPATSDQAPILRRLALGSPRHPTTTRPRPSHRPPSETTQRPAAHPSADPAELHSAASGRPGAARPALPTTWTLRPGDSLWRVAEVTVTDAWGRTPPEEVVGHYWWQLVAFNRPHLPDPSNPDLVFPGDVITLPPLPQP